MTEFFYNDTQPAFAETRITSDWLQIYFVGFPPFVFKPGMPFEGRVSVMFHDQVRFNHKGEEPTLNVHSLY